MKFFFLFLVLSISLVSFSDAQTVLSRHELEYKKPPSPYGTRSAVGLGDQECIMLLEQGKGKFRLVRFDKYFFEKWRASLDYRKEGGFPQLFKLGEEALVFRLWSEKGKVISEITGFDISTGAQTRQAKKELFGKVENADKLSVSFSDDKSKFVLSGIYSDDGFEELFQLYDAKTLDLVGTFKIEKAATEGKAKAVFVGEKDEIFVALADTRFFSIEIFFFSDPLTLPVKLSSVFSLRRPADNASSIKILQQSPSTYLVVTPLNIDEESIGMNISSFNVVLKTVLYSNSYDFDAEFIKSAYLQNIITSENQRKKHITTPENLEHFRLQQAVTDSQGGITCIFENSELPVTYHSAGTLINAPIKWKQADEKYYFAEDILFLNFSSSGETSWKKAIQKTQYGRHSSLALSYVGEVFDDQIKIIVSESSKGPSFYMYAIDLLDGGIAESVAFMEKKTVMNKNYSTWIDEKTLLLCADPEGSRKKTLFLIEL